MIRTRNRGRAAIVAAVVLGLVVACDNGNESKGTPAASADGVGGSAAAASLSHPEDTMADFVLATTAFTPGGAIPRRFTCDGDDVSPDVSWRGAPDGTAAFVLVVDDPDATGFVHWIAYDLAGSDSGGLPVGASTSPLAPTQGSNDFGRIGWNGPCPPSGEHRYRFTLTALAAPLRLEGAPGIRELRKALARATVLGTASLEGTYRRG